MRKFLIIIGFFAGLVLSGSSVGFAADPVFITPFPESSYSITNTAVTISSESATTFASTNRYRSISFALDGDNTVIYYRADGTITSVASAGFPFVASAGVTIESNNTIAIQIKAGSGDITIRVIEIRK